VDKAQGDVPQFLLAKVEESRMAHATQRITYATMSADPNLHTDFDAAIARVKGTLGQTYPMYINGQAVTAASQFDDRSPIDTRILLGRFQQGGREHVQQAAAAARAAFPGWRAGCRPNNNRYPQQPRR